MIKNICRLQLRIGSIPHTHTHTHTYAYTYTKNNINANTNTNTNTHVYHKQIRYFCTRKQNDQQSPTTTDAKTQNKSQPHQIHTSPPQTQALQKQQSQQNPQTKTLYKQIQQYYSEDDQLTHSPEQDKYTIIPRSYKQTKVPGLNTRKYTDMNKLQQDIISSNKFDLLHPQVIPKTGSSTSYALKQTLTQISLGDVKIKSENQVFLSQVDPYSIPADLDIRFDQGKVLKIVGKETAKTKTKQVSEDGANQQHPNKQQDINNKQSQQLQMQIQPQTIEHKSIKQHMQSQFGIGLKGYQYSNMKSIRRWDIFLTLLSFALLMPIFDTFKELNDFYQSSKAIQEERMKQIVELKRRSYQRVLFGNQDFNRRWGV